MARKHATRVGEKVATDIRVSSFDSSASFGESRTMAAVAPERALQLGYVVLGDDHPRPKTGKDYAVTVASSEVVASVTYPSTAFRRVHLDMFELFIDDMPDFLSRDNEGLLRVQVSTKDPQNLEGSMFDASFVTEFKGRDNAYAPTFLYRGVFRNILLQDWINLKVELFEMDTDASEYYAKIKGVIDKVPEIKELDILKGIPYLNLASRLFDGIITTFGRNPDDHLWGELPILEVQPTPGGAFLRTGIYVLAEKLNSRGEEIRVDRIAYRDGKIRHLDNMRLSTHLIMGLSLVEHVARPK